jgi:hypothetical protein
MKTYKAIVTEKTSPEFGKSFANTKFGKYKGMSIVDFHFAIKYIQCYTYEIVEM